MKDIGIVYGSEEQAKPIIVGVDTVYLHTDIEEIEDKNNNKVFKYNEIQYDKDEFILMMANQLSEQQTLLINNFNDKGV